jgi:hypothetical protein
VKSKAAFEYGSGPSVSFFTSAIGVECGIASSGE